jgi:hypothetical protein
MSQCDALIWQSFWCPNAFQHFEVFTLPDDEFRELYFCSPVSIEIQARLEGNQGTVCANSRRPRG